MALTRLRWLAAAIVGAAAITGLILRNGQSNAAIPEYARLTRRAADARRRLDVAINRLRVLQIRDSLAAVSRKVGGREGQVWIDRQLPPRLARELNAGLAQASVTRPATPVVPVDVAMILDSGTTFRGQQRGGRGEAPSITYFTPTSASGRCLVLLTVRSRLGSRLMRPDLRSSLLGPCAFYESFGVPGPAVDRWLADRGWMVGHMTNWNTPGLVAENDGRSPWFFGDPGFPLREQMSPVGNQCAAGDRVACAAALVQPDPSGSEPAWGNGAISTGPRLMGLIPAFGWTRPLGPYEGDILAEMVRTLGPEKFKRFWQSQSDVPTAFQTATGIPLGEWTSQWSERTYGKQHLGPGLQPVTAGIGVVLVAVGLMWGFAEAEKKTFG